MISQALIAGACGGLLWLDRFQFCQVMVSRPIVSAPVVGWVTGDLLAGVASGVVFELLWLRRPPVGGYIPPDATLGAVSTAAVAAIVRTHAPLPPTAMVFLAFLLLFPVSHLGRRIDTLLRTSLGRLARKTEEELDGLDGAIPVTRLLQALLLGFVMAFGTLVSIILLGSWVLTGLVDRLSDQMVSALSISYYIVPLVAVADLVAGLEKREHVILFLLSFAGILGGGLALKFFS